MRTAIPTEEQRAAADAQELEARAQRCAAEESQAAATVRALRAEGLISVQQQVAAARGSTVPTSLDGTRGSEGKRGMQDKRESDDTRGLDDARGSDDTRGSECLFESMALREAAGLREVAQAALKAERRWRMAGRLPPKQALQCALNT